MSQFMCIQGDEIVYKAASLAQAQGFADGGTKATKIVVDVVPVNRPDYFYKLSVVDRRTGQIICDGPIVDLMEAADLLDRLAVVVLPADVKTPEYLLKQKYLSDIEDEIEEIKRETCAFCLERNCSCDGEGWKDSGDDDDELDGGIA